MPAGAAWVIHTVKGAWICPGVRGVAERRPCPGGAARCCSVFCILKRSWNSLRNPLLKPLYGAKLNWSTGLQFSAPPPPSCLGSFLVFTAAGLADPLKPPQVTSAPWDLMSFELSASWMSPVGSSIEFAPHREPLGGGAKVWGGEGELCLPQPPSVSLSVQWEPGVPQTLVEVQRDDARVPVRTHVWYLANY